MANRKIYETIFALGAKVQASLGKGFGAVQQNMKAVQQQANRTKQATKQFSNALKWAAGYFSVNAIMNYAKQSSEAAKVQLNNETKLAVVMKQRMKATDEQVKSILKLTSAQQALGVIGDEVQLGGAQQLATFLKQKSSLEILIPAMNNLVAQQKGLSATSEDAVNVANMMGKVLDGNVGALRRVGISFSAAEERALKYGNEQQRAAMLAQVITNNVGQMNAALAQTDQGRLQQANNLLGDMQEEIGKKIIPLQIKFAQMWIKVLPIVQDKLLPVLDKVPVFIDKIVPMIENIIVKAVEVVNFVINNWGIIKPILLGIISALVTYKVILGVIAVVQAIAFATSPIGLVVLAVGAVIAIGHLLIKNWEKVKAFFSGLWEWLKKNWQDIMRAVFLPFIGIPKLIIQNWSKIKGFFGGGGKKPTPTPKPAPKPVPKYARGTSYHPGGPAIVNERGIELVNLPRGSQVTSNSRTETLLNGLSGGFSSGINLTINQNYYGSPDKETIKEANRESFNEFERRMAAVNHRYKRLNFAQ